MAAELQKALKVDAKLVEGKNGIFNVIVDGKMVFSKAKTHRFPQGGEVARLISAG